MNMYKSSTKEEEEEGESRKCSFYYFSCSSGVKTNKETRTKREHVDHVISY